MMSGAKKRVPKRRFKEFLNAGDWEQRKLRNLLEQPITDGPHETPELYNSGITFISVDAIVDNKIDFTKMRGYISKEYDDICAKKYKPQINDVYLVKSGATIGKVAIVDTYDDFNIWSPLAAMRCGSITNPYFLYILLQTQDLQSQVFNKASHGTQPNLSMRQLEQFTCKVPKIEEQKLISRFLKQLDDVITLHQRKLDKLQATKKALLQEMFPEEGQDKPKRRFKGFTDAWEQRELSSLTEYISTGKSRFVIKEFGEYAILGSTNVIGYDDAYDYDGNFILTARVGANAGQLYRYSGKVKITDNTVFLMSDRSQFIYYALTHFDLRRLSFGTGQPLVKSSELQKLKLCVPVSKSEQEKIGEIFNNIDNIITLHQRKLDKLKNLKQAYLNEMFV